MWMMSSAEIQRNSKRKTKRREMNFQQDNKTAKNAFCRIFGLNKKLFDLFQLFLLHIQSRRRKIGRVKSIELWVSSRDFVWN